MLTLLVGQPECLWDDALHGGLDADLRNDVISRLEQATTTQRVASNESLARTANAWGEARRLRALRNLGVGRSENLALFSVVRQWLVSTVETPAKSIVLIKAYELDKPFEHGDLFVHRQVLQDGLLEPELTDALDHAAAEFEPLADHAPAIESPPSDVVDRAKGKLVVNDPARGRGSVIKISALFEHTGVQRPFSTTVEASEQDQTVEFEIPIESQPLSQLAGWTFEFINPGHFNWDVNAAVTPVEVELIAGEKPAKAAIPGPIALWPGAAKTFPSGLTTPNPPAPQPPAIDKQSNDVRRILAHLNANRAYYRLLIDLCMDPVSRFMHLLERQPRPPMPADLQPVGVAGAHLAFLTDEPSRSPADNKLPILTVLSTPAGGTYLEVLEGRTQVALATQTENWPKVALPQNSTLPWPPAMEMPSVEGAPTETSKDAPKLPEAPSKPEAALPDKIADVVKSIETLQSVVKALQAEVPKKSADGDGKKKDDTNQSSASK
jgi:hypothetical protein